MLNSTCFDYPKIFLARSTLKRGLTANETFGKFPYLNLILNYGFRFFNGSKKINFFQASLEYK